LETVRGIGRACGESPPSTFMAFTCEQVIMLQIGPDAAVLRCA